MNKTAQTEFQRIFLINGLPEPLTPASGHLQIFDNYIEGTRFRLRLMRDPHTKVWTRILQQRSEFTDGKQAVINLSEMYLNDVEYGLFERLRGREIRKNRYFHEFDQIEWKFDIYLGEPRGLMIAKADLASAEQAADLMPPPFALIEITNDPFFAGGNLVEKNFSEIRTKMEQVANHEQQQIIDR